jgi:hypothetical protein
LVNSKLLIIDLQKRIWEIKAWVALVAKTPSEDRCPRKRRKKLAREDRKSVSSNYH